MSTFRTKRVYTHNHAQDFHRFVHKKLGSICTQETRNLILHRNRAQKLLSLRVVIGEQM
ncbi:hypothetical protein BofuT4_uP057850.1 [Botrytis cinerea T4]|uniref:Uncharacterized protein n=1 Tax=Botryotinia fuckeliana (strain T4) TaxID=999810 RepID=G2XUN5_BOTF4|nr:hypothetical protein BofuT4_uP057850.1 [Botrytis cinerea T4]